MSPTQLLEARVTAGAATVLQNAGGSVQLRHPQLGLVFVPEPGALWQLGSGVGLLAGLYARRRRIASRRPSAVGS